MKNNRKLWLIMGMLMLLLLVAACGSDPTPTAEPETVATEEANDDSAEVEDADNDEADDDATDADDEESTNDETEGDDTDEAVDDEESAPVAVEGVADTFPCPASIIPSDETTLSIRYREPTTDPSLMIGRMRPETEISILEADELDGLVWYRANDPTSNVSLNWIEAQYIVLTEECISG